MLWEGGQIADSQGANIAVVDLPLAICRRIIAINVGQHHRRWHLAVCEVAPLTRHVFSVCKAGARVRELTLRVVQLACVTLVRPRHAGHEVVDAIGFRIILGICAIAVPVALGHTSARSLLPINDGPEVLYIVLAAHAVRLNASTVTLVKDEKLIVAVTGPTPGAALGDQHRLVIVTSIDRQVQIEGRAADLPRPARHVATAALCRWAGC
mmetsp:Transcript_121852/g.316322  ORF Transcript_121852/g.316322 Transcript_121852/m.316322 type:complete len:210 (-) Transcript_121852:299-928(-)